MTTREWEVLDLICDGAGPREIAEVLTLTEARVRAHCRTILRKLGVPALGAAIPTAAARTSRRADPRAAATERRS